MFCVVNRWVQYLWGIFAKFSIQITASQVAAVVAIDDTVNVKHRYNIKVKVVF